MRRPGILQIIAFLLVPAPASLAGQSNDPDRRAASVEAKMTNAERFQLLHSVMPIPMAPGRPAPKGVKPMAGYVPGVSRLGVPPLTETDASLGVTNPLQLRKGDVATALPSGLALAATFNPALAFASGQMIGAEARAKGFNVLLGAGVNLARDPRNGRNFEYLGEDPLLAGTMAGEAARGIQSEHVVSTLKHFALNDQETHRDTLNAVIDEGALRESDLLAFELAIERGTPGAIMCAYNRVNGPWACGNEFLLRKVLRKDWGYRGWVMSDWGATHSADDANAGLDQESGANLDRKIWFGKPLRAAVKKGRVSRARISEMVRRILRSLYAVGADTPTREHPIDYEAHARVARRAAAEGIVVLKNDGLLPLTDGKKKILVVGGRAHIGVLSGGGSSQVTPVGGPAALVPEGGPGLLRVLGQQLYMPSSPLRQLRKALPQARLIYDSGYFPRIAASAAKSADLVIVFATQWQIESVDAGSLTLPAGQDRLISEIAAANPHVVVVLETGNPVRMPWLDDVKAVVEAWYPGQRGGAAIADILTGAVNPSGRLPITFPASEAQLPRPEIPGLSEARGREVTVRYTEGSDVGYRWFARTGKEPLFAFGHGLSYTQFTHGGLKITGGKKPSATFTVRNTGRRAGADVPQLYLVAIGRRKRKRLAAFKKVFLVPGESKTVRVEIEPRILADWSNGAWRIAGGEYVFALSESASERGLRASVRLPPRHFGDN